MFVCISIKNVYNSYHLLNFMHVSSLEFGYFCHICETYRRWWYEPYDVRTVLGKQKCQLANFRKWTKTACNFAFLDFYRPVSLTRNTQCVNFRIFLPLRFYVKSILVTLMPHILLLWPFEQLLMNFAFLGTFDIFKYKTFLEY